MLHCNKSLRLNPVQDVRTEGIPFDSLEDASQPTWFLQGGGSHRAFTKADQLLEDGRTDFEGQRYSAGAECSVALCRV
jgi:hypothetical protein